MDYLAERQVQCAGVCVNGCTTGCGCCISCTHASISPHFNLAVTHNNFWSIVSPFPRGKEEIYAQWGGSLTLPNQDIIHRDCQRTRPDCALLNEPGMRLRLEQLLTCYCHSRGVEYKQGLCHLLAPLLLVLREQSQGVVFNCFYSLVAKFLPAVFAHQDFEGLRAMFSHFRLLLVYHDPELDAHVRDADVLPGK